MKNRAFIILLAAFTAVCLMLTIAHFAYMVYAYEHSSVIYFVGKELW